ncbi:hypothetical protein [uncultured Allofournierella sp.]|uniref:phage tail protein n=1 Tax=uncultured Allofournierella sp. TaxID=1940258 RepID=UPI003752399C
MGTSAGSIYIDLIIKNKIKEQTEKAAQQTANVLEKTIQKAGANAGDRLQQTMTATFQRISAKNAEILAKPQQVMQRTLQQAAQGTAKSAQTMGEKFNKSLALAKLKVEQLEAEFESLNAQLDKMQNEQAQALNAPKPNATKTLYQELLREQKSVSSRLVAAEQRLTVELQAQQHKRTAAQQAQLARQQAQQAQNTASTQAQVQQASSVQAAALQRVRQVAQIAFSGIKASARAALASIPSLVKNMVSGVLAGFRKLASGAVASVKALAKGVVSGVRALSRLRSGIKQSTAGMQSFGARLRSIVGGALIFNGISRALTGTITYFKNAVMASGQFRDALANLKGAASTAAAPIVQALTPALTALANAAATVFSYIARLFSLLTGKSVASMKASAVATNQYAQSVSGATDAAKELAEANNTLGIDELNVVQQDSGSQSGSGGGGAGGTVAPDYSFDPQSSLLDKMLESIKQGDWSQVGQLLAEKLNQSLSAIHWPSIEQTARQWVQNLVDTLNGFVQKLDWSLVGDTFANGLNLALHCYDDFFQNFDWTGLGSGLGTGLNRAVQTLDWQAVGRWLTDKLKAALETLHGFVTTFDFASLGSSLAVAIMAAINNIDWVQFAMDLNNLAFGLLEGLQNLIRGIDWAGMGATVREMLASIDWAGIVSGLAYSLGQLAGGIWIFLQEALAGIGEKLGSYFTDIGENGIQGLLKGMWNLLCDIGKWLYNNLIKPMVEGVKEMLGIHSPSRVFLEIGVFLVQGLFKGLSDTWHTVADFFSQKFQWVKNLVGTAWQQIWDNTSTVWQNISSGLKNTLGNILSFVSGAFTGAWSNAWKMVQSIFGGIWQATGQNAINAWKIVSSSLQGAFRGLVDFVAGVFTGNWSRAWQGVQQVFSSVWQGIVEIFRSNLNGIISFLNGMISAVVTGINGMISALNSLNIQIPSWVPGLGGSQFGLNIPAVSAPQIPMLANGGVITQPTLAMMGEYAGAAANPEIVAPESKLRSIMGESVAGLEGTINRLASAIVQMNRQEITATQPIEVTLDGQVLYRAMNQIKARQGRRIGGAFADAY